MNDHLVFGLRTFSKMYGLATIRLGYVVCPSRCQIFRSKWVSLQGQVPKQSIDIAYKNLKDGIYLESHMKFVKGDGVPSVVKKEKTMFIFGVFHDSSDYVLTLNKNNGFTTIFLEQIYRSPRRQSFRRLIMYTLGDRNLHG